MGDDRLMVCWNEGITVSRLSYMEICGPFLMLITGHDLDWTSVY